MNISTDKIDDSNTIIAINGQLDMYSAGELRRVFTICVENGTHNVLLDCSGMNYIDSSGVGAFIHLLQLLKGHKGGHAVYGLNELPNKVLSMCNVIRLLNVYPDKTTARQALIPEGDSYVYSTKTDY